MSVSCMVCNTKASCKECNRKDWCSRLLVSDKDKMVWCKECSTKDWYNRLQVSGSNNSERSRLLASDNRE